MPEEKVSMPDLKKQIEDCQKCRNAKREKCNPWLFPKKEGVDGFLGCSKTMFVGDRPSTGKSDDDKLDDATELFYSLLRKNGFEEAHLTDLTKCRRKVEETVRLQEISKCLEHFKKELASIEPIAIVALGDTPYTILEFLLPALGKPNIQLEQIWHYSYAKRRKHEDEYANKFEKLKSKLKRL